MLGLWSLASMPMALSLHVAFDVELNHVLPAGSNHWASLSRRS